jgi:hypothetical protein
VQVGNHGTIKGGEIKVEINILLLKAFNNNNNSSLGMNTFNTVGHVAHFEQQHMSKGPRGGMPSNVGSSYGGGPGQMQSFQGN